jgi:RimJ/RimL family protein N-acetyltransferase
MTGLKKMVMPKVLSGSRVKLLELEDSHIDELWESAKYESIWTHYTFRKMETKERFGNFIRESLEEAKIGKGYTFTIIDKASGKMSGGTSFLDINPESRSLEIGRTWLANPLQGSGLNYECKYLLLGYCFETLGLIRVFFKTDSNNKRSQKALEKIGAKYEGVLRNHMIREDGTFRHSVFYSIIESEWQGVRKHLEICMGLSVK